MVLLEGAVLLIPGESIICIPIKHILNKKMFLHYGDLVDTSNLNRLLEKYRT